MSKLRITPIGTCRIHSPLRRAAARYEIEVDVRRNYGYVHTSVEALQQLEFLLGETDFPLPVAPLIMRDGKDGDYYNEVWEPADLHLIEISSAKSIKCDGNPIQSNYLYRQFADFFANSARSRSYWNLVKKGHRGRLSAFLRDQPSFRMLQSSDRDLLLSMSIEQQSFKSVKEDMERIVERLGADRVLFVTHVNALTPDHEKIPSRDRLIHWVRLAAEQIGVGVFDPTPSMLEFGQERALEKAGLDLTHYTPAFFEKLYEDLHRSNIGAFLETRFGTADAGLQTEDRVDLLAANFETMLEMGDFFATSKQIHAAFEKAPDALPLAALRGLIRSRTGDYANAVSDFDRSEKEVSLSLPVRTAMVEAYSEVGDHGKALQIAEGLIADEFASAEIYAAAAKAAEQCGRMETALRHAKQAFRLDREDLGAALDALKLMSRHSLPDEITEWRREILDHTGESSSGAFEICVWAIEHHDQELFTVGLQSIGVRDKGGAIDLLEDALKAEMDRAVADCIPALMAIGRLSRSMAERRSAILTGLLARAEVLVGERRLDDAFHVASAIVGLFDVESSQVQTRKLASAARQIVREIIKDMRVTVREAYARRDTAAILELRDVAGAILIDEPDVAVIVGRTLFTEGREDDALALIKRIHGRHPDHVQAMRWTGRMAFAAGDYTTAIRAYGQLRSLSPEQADPFRAEIDRFFAAVDRRAFKQLRALVADDDVEGVIALAAEIQKHGLDVDGRAERELDRLFRSLRKRLKEIEEGQVEIEERELVLRQMFRLNSTDEGVLRRLALELMRQFRFAEAAETWESILSISPDNESAARNVERCRRLAARRSPAPGRGAEAAA